MKTLFCKDCKVVLCGLCFTLKHKTHRIKHISEHLEFVKKSLWQSVQNSVITLMQISSNKKYSSSRIHENGMKATLMKDEIKKRGEDIKKDVDSIVEEFIKTVDGELKQQQIEADGIKKELDKMEKEYHEQYVMLQERLNNLNCENISEEFPKIIKTTRNPVIYSKTFKVSSDFSFAPFKFGPVLKGTFNNMDLG